MTCERQKGLRHFCQREHNSMHRNSPAATIISLIETLIGSDKTFHEFSDSNAVAFSVIDAQVNGTCKF